MQVVGWVEGKRKRADGTLHIGIHPVLLQPTISPSLSPIPIPTTRVIQLICTDETIYYPNISYDIVSLICKGSYIHGTAIFISQDVVVDDLQPKVGRNRYYLTHLKVLRISSFPEQISKILSYAQTLTTEEKWVYDYLNEVICPKPLEIAEISPLESLERQSGQDYIAGLLKNPLAIKTHCHLMTTYDPTNRGSLRGISLEKIDGNEGVVDYSLIKRPPRRRNRKVSIDEKFILDLFEVFTESHLRLKLHNAATSVSVTTTSCIDDNQDMIDYHQEYLSHEIINVPAGDLSAPSNRGPSTRGSYLHDKKHPQIHWITNRILEMLRSAPICTESSKLQIFDIGGGRGDLSVCLASTLEKSFPGQFHITVLDMNERSLVAGREYAENCHLSQRITFENIDFRDYVFQEMQKDCNNPLNNSDSFVVVGLHICGDLTDLALKYFLSLSNTPSCHRLCGVLIVPCCYSKCCLNRLGKEDDISLIEEWRGWVLEGHHIQSYMTNNPASVPPNMPVDWELPLSDDKYREIRRSLCTLAESNPREYQWRAMLIISLLRLCYLIDTLHHQGTMKVDSIPSQWHLSLQSFSNQYSLRNIVICGNNVHTGTGDCPISLSGNIEQQI